MLEIAAYLEEIEASRTVRGRVDEFRTRYKALMPDVAFDRVFITEIRDSEGLHVWQNLWLVAPPFLAEVRNFLSDDEFDCAIINGVSHWKFQSSDFELRETPSEKSRLSLKFSFADTRGFSNGLTGEMNASGVNCAHLLAFFEEVIRPLFRSDSPGTP